MAGADNNQTKSGRMVVKAAATVAAMAEAKTAAEGAVATSAPKALAMTGAGNGRGRQQ